MRCPKYEGSHYRFEGFIVDPCAVQARVPIWLGGRTARSLRRALASGDGWDPFGLKIDELADLIARAKDWPEYERRAEPFDIALPLICSADLASVAEKEEKLRAAGATCANVMLCARSASHYLEQLEAFAVGMKFGADGFGSNPTASRLA